MDEQSIRNLISASLDARLNSYSRYSKFRVGAALLCDDGTIDKGCNVENVSYGLTVCAEQVAIVKAVSEGRCRFKAIAISSDLPDHFTSPCGKCRQFLLEFGNYDVYLTKPDGSYKKTTVAELLPDGFTSDMLDLVNGNDVGNTKPKN